MTTETTARDDRRARILDAAQELFLRYGVKRTSVDDVARLTGIAKGTVYLSFASKDELFIALAERMSSEALARACALAAGSAPVAERITDVLDTLIGEFARLLEQSPHAAELIDTKRGSAAPVFAAYYGGIDALLAELLAGEGITAADAPQLFRAAAHGALDVGDKDAIAYRARLKRLVETLLAGLRP